MAFYICYKDISQIYHTVTTIHCACMDAALCDKACERVAAGCCEGHLDTGNKK